MKSVYCFILSNLTELIKGSSFYPENQLLTFG